MLKKTVIVSSLVIVFATALFVPINTYTSSKGLCANNTEKHYSIIESELSEFKLDRKNLQNGNCSVSDTDNTSCPDCPPGSFNDGYVVLKLKVF